MNMKVGTAKLAILSNHIRVNKYYMKSLKHAFVIAFLISLLFNLKSHLSLVESIYNVKTLVDNNYGNNVYDINEEDSININENSIMADKCSGKMDIRCIKRLWEGESVVALADDLRNKKLEVSIVISHCSPKLNMDLFRNYIDIGMSNVSVRSITVITCPEAHGQDFGADVTNLKSDWEYEEIGLLQWLANITSPSSVNPTYYLQDNHFVLVLNEGALNNDNPTRALEKLLYAALEHKFACVKQADTDSKSYYHDKQILRKYRGMKRAEYHYDLGQWQDLVNLTSIMGKELVPVCYSRSFAIPSQHLLFKSKLYNHILNQMLLQSKQYENVAASSNFLERSWASIFSQHLSENDNLILKTFSTNKFDNLCCQNGALMFDFHHSYLAPQLQDDPNFKFFNGDTVKNSNGQANDDIDISKLRLSLVISHCNENMEWMHNYTKDLPISNVTIYSKCDSNIEGYDHAINQSTIIRLPNVGRCDHSYAHWMRQMGNEDATDDHIVLFIKASRDLYQKGMSYRPLKEVIRLALHSGFSCESRSNEKSYYHISNLLQFFMLQKHKQQDIKSKYRYMGGWLKDVGIELPQPYTPVCYGGNFAVKASQIHSKKDILKSVETSLSRGDNIEEGHFMERAWAGLLSNPLTFQETHILNQSMSQVFDVITDGYIGHFTYNIEMLTDNDEHLKK